MLVYSDHIYNYNMPPDALPPNIEVNPACIAEDPSLQTLLQAIFTENLSAEQLIPLFNEGYQVQILFRDEANMTYVLVVRPSTDDKLISIWYQKTEMGLDYLGEFTGDELTYSEALPGRLTPAALTIAGYTNPNAPSLKIDFNPETLNLALCQILPDIVAAPKKPKINIYRDVPFYDERSRKWFIYISQPAGRYLLHVINDGIATLGWDNTTETAVNDITQRFEVTVLQITSYTLPTEKKPTANVPPGQFFRFSNTSGIFIIINGNIYALGNYGTGNLSPAGIVINLQATRANGTYTISQVTSGANRLFPTDIVGIVATTAQGQTPLLVFPIVNET